MVRTTCPYCGVGCGVLAKARRGRRRRRPRRPRPSGQFRPALLEGRRRSPRRSAWTDRLLHPEDRRAARRLGRRRSTSSPRPSRRRSPSTDRTRSPSTSPASLLTEDYYVANKLMKGFIGSANIDTNSRLCMASSVAGHRRAFGSDTVPGMLRGSRTGRSRRAGRLEPRLVPPGALPAHRRGQGEAARDEGRAHRSAPHHDRRHRRPASADRARRRRRAVHRPARAIWRRARRARPRLHRRAHQRL